MRMVFGRYMPYNSVVHRMDPRIKLFMVIALIVAVFMPVGFTGFVLIGTGIICMYTISKLSFKMLFKLFTPILFIFIMLIILNIFVLHPETNDTSINWTVLGSSGARYAESSDYGYIFNYKKLWFSEKALYRATYMTLRIFLMITLTTILTGTTQPLELTLAIEDLLWPLKLIGIPVYIFSIIISIALRMIPTLIDEAGRIMKAQSSRGIDFKNGNLADKVKGTTSLIIPLLVSSFNKAEDLAFAMDSRGFDPHAKRTRYRQVKFRLLDWVIFLIYIGIAAILFCYPYVEVLRQVEIPRIDAILNL
ncbi:energy-coupling factor transporter transmembrane component T family protein [Spiroplasma tabanidicola]|uniref:Energy-coupling factor transport system permease protein n=1 Tax=Spiroplasma tabanidicola TaxID=324079 RepID=A0A6I6CJS8_9MOLU|nr:energy-coupling factor transporter transmembrane component T [Spiroplasma tabanidicola]QGS52343.1 energy-coupling factor transport system permease protein [Spiroplasma tabanidicola]